MLSMVYITLKCMVDLDWQTLSLDSVGLAMWMCSLSTQEDLTVAWQESKW